MSPGRGPGAPMRRPAPRALRAAAFAAPAAAALALWAGLPLSSGAQSAGELESQIESHQSRESSLQESAAAFGRLEAKLERDIALLQRRLAAVQAQLERSRAELERIRGDLRRARRRLAILRARLAYSKRVLARRLVEMYQSGHPDIITVVLNAKGFADLLERREFLRRIKEQDQRIIEAVRRARDAARRAAQRLARLEARQERVVAAVQAQRNALVQMSEALAARRRAAAQARAARLAALSATRSDRRRLQRKLDQLIGSQGSTSRYGPGGPWAIPWAIVQCESGGQNLPPNWAGASGYYQIIPSTWAGFGGSGPHAYLASKGEQDSVASRIWAGGSGAHNWDCWHLINFGEVRR
jgi:peptidoglycan hydrolase CwlO-like protein